VLIDDVMTSGATVFEAARTLLQAGARRVDAAIFARTPHG
jgi:predicted amidophosphoribosyltransferase